MTDASPPAVATGDAAAALSPFEARALLALVASSRPITDAEIADASGLSRDQARSSAEFLRVKGALETLDEEREQVSLSDEAGAFAATGREPRRRILDEIIAAKRAGTPLGVGDITKHRELDGATAGSAFGWLKDPKKGLLAIEGQTVLPTAGAEEGASPWCAYLARAVALLARVHAAEASATDVFTGELDAADQDVIKNEGKKKGKGGLFKLVARTLRRYRTTDAGRALVATARAVASAAENEIGQLTAEHVRDGSWRGKTFRRYSINLKPPRTVVGRRHPYREFLDRVKRSLIGLGFQEMVGPLVESEFWNMDALFMPQFHPARQIHDAYYVASPTHAKAIPAPFLENVASAHENGGGTGSTGWCYAFDRERTKRLLLRSQGTALSSRTMAAGPRVPGKYFGMARCFRSDTVDATHAADFFQVEGIVLGEEISFRHLLGLLKIFALEIAGSEVVKFAPTYFPFTEPSVEIHMKHPRLGWVELGGSGMFRPELTRPLGVTVPVIAWGLGLDRMAMVALGIDDIRELFSGDLELIRSKKLRP